MFKTISWGQYAGVVLLLLVLYYAYVGAMFYRAELLALLRGKGRTGGPGEAPAPTLATVARKGPLLTKSAITLPAPPPEVAGPAPAPVTAEVEPIQPIESGELDGAGSPAEGAQELAGPDAPTSRELPMLDLASVEFTKNNNYENISEFTFINDNTSILAKPNDADLLAATGSGSSSTFEEFELGSTVGIAQLGDFLKRAAESQLTPAEVVEQVPALDNTDLLLAFFQTSSKSAQRLTSQRFAEVAEPGLG